VTTDAAAIPGNYLNLGAMFNKMSRRIVSVCPHAYAWRFRVEVGKCALQDAQRGELHVTGQACRNGPRITINRSPTSEE